MVLGIMAVSLVVLNYQVFRFFSPKKRIVKIRKIRGGTRDILGKTGEK